MGSTSCKLAPVGTDCYVLGQARTLGGISNSVIRAQRARNVFLCLALVLHARLAAQESTRTLQVQWPAALALSTRSMRKIVARHILNASHAHSELRPKVRDVQNLKIASAQSGPILPKSKAGKSAKRVQLEASVQTEHKGVVFARCLTLVILLASGSGMKHPMSSVCSHALKVTNSKTHQVTIIWPASSALTLTTSWVRRGR